MAAEPELSGVAPVPPNDADVASADYLLTRGWLHADHFHIGDGDSAVFGDETDLWGAALSGSGFFETRRITLDDVVLTDWVPRSPGRYYTREAKAAREEARQRIAERHATYVVYDAAGKTSMVQGGVGCLRLAMKEIGGQEIKFLGATSSGVVHRSFVVALDRDRYASIADIIDRYGGVRCTISGTVRSWNPAQKLGLFMAADVPRIYLGVDDIRRGTSSQTDLPPLDVTPAVTFDVGGAEYFAYSHFEPSDPGEISRAVEWIGSYVGERYHGRVLTDFDELVTRFADTVAPLEMLMNPSVPFQISTASLAHHISGRNLVVITNNVGEIVMGDRYEITDSQVGAVGPGAQAHGNTFVQQKGQEIDVEALAEELGRLRLALKEHGTDAEQDVAVGEVAAAESAARRGDTDGALKHLKGAGQWALAVATEIGVPIAVAALKSVLG